MLRDAAVDMLMKRFGNSNDLTLQDDIIKEMVEAQRTVLEGDVVYPWFLVSEESSSVTIVGDERLPLPADFVALWEYGVLARYDATLDDPYVEMVREDWDVINEHLNFSGKPTHYDIAGIYLLMRPLSDAAYPLRFWYIAKGADLSGTYGDANNIENAWLKNASDWLLAETSIKITEYYLHWSKTKVDSFKVDAVRARKRVYDKNVAMEETLKRRIMR